MKIKFIILALITTTVNLFGDQCHREGYQCEMAGHTLEADIIVVGGGASGCILMSKLSEEGHFSVLGLEGGRNLTNDPAIEAVGLPAYLLAGTGKPQYFCQDGTKPYQCLDSMEGLVIGQQEWFWAGARPLTVYTMAVVRMQSTHGGKKFLAAIIGA